MFTNNQSIVANPRPWNQQIRERFFVNSWIFFYQGTCLNFSFYPMSIACLQLKIRHWQKVAIKFEKAESANSLPFTRNGCLFMWVAYFCMGAYKRRCCCWNQNGCLYSWGVYDFTMEICGFNYPISIPTGILVGRIVISLIPKVFGKLEGARSAWYTLFIHA